MAKSRELPKLGPAAPVMDDTGNGQQPSYTPDAPRMQLSPNERVQACAVELQKLLQRFECDLQPVAQLTIEGPNVVVAHPAIQIVAKP